MSDDERDDLGRFTSDNTASRKHGGEAAILDLSHGRALRGLVAELAKEAAVELHELGPVEFLWQRAIDHAGVARLYLGLLTAEDDPITLDTYVKRFGWLNDKTFRMVRDLVKLERENGGGDGELDYETILAERMKHGHPADQ